MMKNFSIVMPCGQIQIVMGLHNIAPMFAHEVVRSEVVHVPKLILGTVLERPPMETEVSTHRLVSIGMVSELISINPSQVSQVRIDRAMAFIVERLKCLVARKQVEFYVPDLTLEKVEELGYKYMEQMGSDQGVLCIFQLSKYHKFAALIDVAEAIRLYRNEATSFGELVEINPSKWVLGRYDNDLTIMKQMEGMRRYNV